MARKKLLVLLTVVFLVVGIVAGTACALPQKMTAEEALEEAGAFNPVKVAQKGAMSIYIVNGDVPCVVFTQITTFGTGIGMSCDFSKGDVLKGLR